MNQTIRWGICGTGNIARQFAGDLRSSRGAELHAIGSRTIENAQRFAREFGVANSHGSYESLANDSEVDVVYIATPHSLHLENMRLFLNSGKHVLCEKPFTLNTRQARQAMELAAQKKLFLMEAMWTRFLPSIVELLRLITAGTIGPVRFVTADLGFRIGSTSPPRLFDPALGGGCLLDIGIYPVSLAAMILGKPTAISGQARMGQNGVDVDDAVCMSHSNGGLSCLHSSFSVATAKEARVIGTEGNIHLYRDWWKGGPMSVHFSGKRWEVNLPPEANGYQYEADEVARCIREGKIESQMVPHSETVMVMEIMDELRRQFGLKYPGE